MSVETNLNKTALLTGCIFSVLSVTLGAFGTHALSDGVTAERLETWQTGTRYMMTHGLALLFIGIIAQQLNKSFGLQTWLLIAGTALFSGSLLFLVLLNQSWLGAIAPIGGCLIIAGWCGMIVGIAKQT